ncbi:MAG TPA: ABC transporter permease [Acidimicrobiia bacterium]|jgi:ABC-type transport system involved in multi-copper enzyme maturation permease subunit|nr:ABC transporter permease [Acidimicrobiia bacterium]
MIRVIRAELLRLVRRRTVAVATAACLAFAVIATLTVFSTAQDSGVRSRRAGTTLTALAGNGGGTEAFAVGAAFVGFFVFVTVIGVMASEFSGGTFRALLLRNPGRRRLIVGKLAGILIVAAGAVAFAEAVSFALSLLIAPTKDVPTDHWFSLASLGAGLRDYATVLAGVAGWAVFGTTLAVVFRSVPIALAVGFAWAGPFENITVDSWTGGYRVFPGQVLASLIQGGTAELGLGRAVLTAALYTGVAAIVTLSLVSRRDVTA